MAPATADLLGRADELVASGSPLDAIRLLTDADRDRPDADLERRLVQLRVAAYDQLDHPEGPSTWPPVCADRFADVTGPPEVAASELTADTLAAGIVHHGCLLVRGLVGADLLPELIEGIDRAFAMCDARGEGTPLEETAPWYVPITAGPQHSLTIGERWWIRNGGGVWAADSPRLARDLIAAFDTAGLRDTLAGYLGEPPTLSVKKWTLRRVPVDTGTEWHQDGAFLGSNVRSVNVWLTLTDCGLDAPSLDLVPKRIPEVLETGTNGALFDWSVGPGTVEQVAADVEIVRPEFRAGDALLFDERFLHRTGVGPGMTKERYAVESWFFAPSHYPDDQIPIVF